MQKSGCSSISILGQGTFNIVYKVVFSDGTEVAISIPEGDAHPFNPAMKLSEIATMAFVRESGLYPDVPVPQVYAYDITSANSAGTPYTIMELMKGRQLAELHAVRDDCYLTGWDSMSLDDQMVVVQSMARLQASLSQPVPFESIGCLTFSEGGTVVGPLFVGWDTFREAPYQGGPFKSLHDVWISFLSNEFRRAVLEWQTLETEQIAKHPHEPKSTPHEFVELFKLFFALIPQFAPPDLHLPLALHHPDLALRNILFDDNDLSKVTGLLDWSGSQIFPMILCAHRPDDLHSIHDDPVSRPGDPYEDWSTVPHNWVDIRKGPIWPIWLDADGIYSPTNFRVRGMATIRRFYLRGWFDSWFLARALDLGTIERTFPVASLFDEATFYLKFHEVLTGGWVSWVRHSAWIRETFRRVQRFGARGGAIVVGPNVYMASVRRPKTLNLALLEERRSGDDMPHRRDHL